MADLALPWGGDLSVDETGDLACVSGVQELMQRVIRRFLTSPYVAAGAYSPASPPDYVYDKTYGAGARLYVDRRMPQSQLNAVKNRFLDACNSELEVSQTTPPTITTTFSNGALYLTATVTLATGQTLLIPTLELSA